jgi:hypothetical protein
LPIPTDGSIRCAVCGDDGGVRTRSFHPQRGRPGSRSGNRFGTPLSPRCRGSLDRSYLHVSDTSSQVISIAVVVAVGITAEGALRVCPRTRVDSLAVTIRLMWPIPCAAKNTRARCMNVIAAWAFLSVKALGVGMAGTRRRRSCTLLWMCTPDPLDRSYRTRGSAGQPDWRIPNGAYRTAHSERRGTVASRRSWICPSTRGSTNRPRWSRQSTPRHNPRWTQIPRKSRLRG